MKGLSMSFFELSHPWDMFNKTLREFDRLSESCDIDNVFNFFVTAYHIQDYVITHSPHLKDQIQDLFKDKDLKLCRDLCNQGKHMLVSRGSNPSTKVVSGAWGTGSYGEGPWGGGEDWFVEFEEENVSILPLAARVMEKWQNFLMYHQLIST